MTNTKLIWIGLGILVMDLLSYFSQIRDYFTTFGQILLVVSILLIIAGIKDFKL